jgi:hypothetical protein
MTIYAIDPGPEMSAYVAYDSDAQSIVEARILENNSMLATVRHLHGYAAGVLVIEQVACMGMAVGAEVFETVFWSGRFAEAFTGRKWDRIKRAQVKMHLCGSMRAKDGNIRQALIDRFGKPGTKKNPGKTYGLAGDMWQALAVAVTYAELPSTSEAK